MSERISFDRPTQLNLSNIVLEIIRDKEDLLDGWERVYTVVSVIFMVSQATKIRWGTGGEDIPKWHEEEPNPVANVYYHTEREYHCRRHDRGIIGIYGGTLGDEIIVNWHGYDKLIGKR